MSIGGAQSETGDSTSVSLLRRAKANDSAAWERLSRLYSPLVYQWCRRFGLHAADAADVVQDTFRSVALSIGQFRHDAAGGSFRGWLWTIARNKVHDFHRRQGRQAEAAGGTTAHRNLQQLPEMAPEEADESSRQQVTADLAERALVLMQTDFEERTWRAFWLTAVEQKTAAEAGQELALSTAAVYMAKSRVLRRLREELDGLDLIE